MGADGSDMICGMLALLAATLLSAPDGFYLTPDIYGDRVAFSSEGDIWVGDLKSRKAVRLTTDAGTENFPRFSPDGTQIAFQGEYDGARQAYVISAEGGAPKRLSNTANFRGVSGWTPDGKNVVFRARGVPTGYQYFTVPADGGAAVAMPLEFASHVEFSPSGGDYALTRFARFYMAWFRYIGGMQNQIWTFRDGKFKQITNLEGTNEFPAWVGDQIYFANEQKAQFTLMSVPAKGGPAKKVAGPFPTEVRNLAGDGRRLVYERGTDLELFDPESGKAEVLSFERTTDMIHTRPTLVDAARFASASSLSPNAKRVFVESRGQIISLPVGEGEARVWMSKPGARLRFPVMSPDAKKVAYFSDEGGEFQVMVANADGSGGKAITSGSDRQLVNMGWSPDSKLIAYNDSTMSLHLVDVETGKDKNVARTTGSWGGVPFSFSPDSKWIAIQNFAPISQIGQLALYEVATGNMVPVSNGRSNDTAPAFSTDGKYLAFLSQRSLSAEFDGILNQLNTAPSAIACLLPLSSDYADPFALKDASEDAVPKAEEKKDAPMRLDVAGLYERRIEVPLPSGKYTSIGVAGNRVLVAGDGTISTYDLAAKAAGVLTAGQSFELSKDGSKALVNPGMRVVDTTGSSLPPTAGAVGYGGLKLRVEPLPEWKQAYWDAWRLLRDYFYVQNMHGVNWKAIGDKYATFLPRVRARNELDELIRWLQSELGSSHEYLQPGDQQDIKTRTVSPSLGIDVVPDPSGYYKIAKIIRGDGFRTDERSPLARPDLKVSEGMFLIEVAGVPARVGQDIFQGLEGRPGQIVSVKVNDKPSPDGARTVLVKPVANDGRMRYLEWVEANRRYVDKLSGGKVGYLHLSAMSQGDMADFVKQYFPQRNKEALLVDVRFNNGGNIQEAVNRVLSATLHGFFNMRNSSESWSRQGDVFFGPMACLINEFNISCGEEFPLRFKDLKRGPLIGRRTMGGEVGSDPGWPLIDGGVVNVPNYGMYTPRDGWVIEGRGVEPDIDVPSDPNAFLVGKDPQIDRAVEYLLAEIKKSSRPALTPPKDRDRVGGG